MRLISNSHLTAPVFGSKLWFIDDNSFLLRLFLLLVFHSGLFGSVCHFENGFQSFRWLIPLLFIVFSSIVLVCVCFGMDLRDDF